MIYEYVCAKCRSKFEVNATLAEKEKGLKPECPHCGSCETIQFFGGFAIGAGKRVGVSGSRCGPDAGKGCCG